MKRILVFAGIFIVVSFVIAACLKLNQSVIYAINNNHLPRQVANEAMEQRQSGEYLRALLTYSNAYMLALDGEIRLFIARVILRGIMNNPYIPMQYEGQLRWCKVASGIAGQHDPEGVIGSGCATISTLIEIRDCEQSCSGKCNYVNSDLICDAGK